MAAIEHPYTAPLYSTPIHTPTLYNTPSLGAARLAACLLSIPCLSVMYFFSVNLCGRQGRHGETWRGMARHGETWPVSRSTSADWPRRAEAG